MLEKYKRIGGGFCKRMIDIFRAGGLHLSDYAKECIFLLLASLRDKERMRAMVEQVKEEPARVSELINEAVNEILIPLGIVELSEGLRYETSIREAGTIISIMEAIDRLPLGAPTSSGSHSFNTLEACRSDPGSGCAPESVQICRAIIQYMVEKTGQQNYFGQYFTPPGVCSLVARLLELHLTSLPSSLKLYDPAVGMGSLIFEAYRVLKSRGLSVSLHGKEKNKQVALLGRAILSISTGDLIGSNNYKVCDTLATPDSMLYDVIVANPPFGRGSSSYNVFGNRTCRLEAVFLKHISEHLAPGGLAFVITSNNLYRRDFAGLRSVLVDNLSLWAVITFPDSIFAPYTTARTCLLIFRKEQPSRDHRVLMAEVTECAGGFDRISPAVINEVISSFSSSPLYPKVSISSSLRASLVPLDVIRGNGYRLTPNSYLYNLPAPPKGWELRPLKELADVEWCKCESKDVLKRIHSIVPKTDRVTREYLTLYLEANREVISSKCVYKFIVPHVDISAFLEILIPVPPPDVMFSIVQEISQARASIKRAEEEIKKHRRHLSNLMGKLRGS